MRNLLVLAGIIGVMTTGLAAQKYQNLKVDPPNYNSSKMIVNMVSAVHNGKKVELKMLDYYNFDTDKLILSDVSILYNEDDRVWLMFNVVIDVRHGVSSSQVNIFERLDSKWSYVVTIKNLTDGSVTGSVNDFVKDKYRLEFK